MRKLVPCLLVLGVAACGDPPRVSPISPPLPSGATGDFGELHVTANAFVERGSLDPSRDRLCIVSGNATADTYETTSVIVCTTAHAGGVPYMTPSGATCTGSARYAEHTWTIDLHGTGCERWNGTHASTERPRLPDTDPAFVAALADLDALHASDAPCPVALRAPAEDITTSDSPGQAALQHSGEGSGEEFEMIHADVGGPLPTRPESHARYQAVYVREAHVDPEIDPGTQTFTAGSSHGRAYLVDTSVGRVVCMGAVEARNGDAIRGSSEAMAGMWLALQLDIAEERAIALGLHALAE